MGLAGGLRESEECESAKCERAHLLSCFSETFWCGEQQQQQNLSMSGREGPDWLRRRWCPRALPDCVFLASLWPDFALSLDLFATETVLRHLRDQETFLVIDLCCVRAQAAGSLRRKHCSQNVEQKTVVRKSSCECVRV